jgi:protein TonB
MNAPTFPVAETLSTEHQAPARESYRAGRAGGSFLGRINWPAVGITILLEAVLLATFVNLGIVSLNRPAREKATVVELLPISQPAEASPQPAPAEQPQDPTVQPPVKTEVVAHPPEVVLPTPAPVQVASQAPQPDPAPVVSRAPAPVAAPVASGPVNVANLGASLVSGTPPRYPVEARRKREQGTVVLKLVISEQGAVTDISIHKSSGFSSLDTAAIEAVRKWRWSPLLRDGRAVPITGLVQIPFILKNS